MNKIFLGKEICVRISLCFLCWLLPNMYSNTWAQNNSLKEIKGVVTDIQGPLPGVSILVKGQNKGTVTDSNGAFQLMVKTGDQILFSYIGYEDVTVVVAVQNFLTITMKESVTSLEEVTVNAGYYTVKEKENTGSIAKISKQDIEKQPVTNFLATMQGRLAGVDIVQDSGSPGGAFRIRIRGINSIRADGNDPLYLIDGVPYSSETIGSIPTSGTAPTLTSPLNSINPADIESIEILKDADATAIYGSRGANGVVLITTKKGKVGKTKITIQSSTSVGQVTQNPKLMNTAQYLQMRDQAFANDGVTVLPGFAYDVNGIWDRNRETDWQKVLLGGTANIHTLQASIGGGSATTQYVLSGNYRTETTVFPGDFIYKKGGAHFSMNHTSEDQKWKINFTSNYTSQNNLQPADDLTRISRTLAPNAPALFDANGELNWENSTWENPLAKLQSEFRSKINDFNANAILAYYLKPNWFIQTSFGYSDLQSLESRTMPSTMFDPGFGFGSEVSSIQTNQTNRNSWIVEPQMHWNTSFGKNKIQFLAGSTFQKQTTDRLILGGFGFSSNSLLYDLSAANLQTIDLNDASQYQYQAVFARLNYQWNGTYLVNITGRRDGSSRFGPGKKYANFGAIGAAWIFTKEKFLEENSWLSFGKLRSSYGITGNDQIGDYQFFDTYNSTGVSYEGVIGLQPIRLFNPDFGWETNKKWEIALETGFLNDRIFLTSSFYLNRSSNQLVGIPLPGTTGFSSLTANLDATVQNKGWEFTLRTVNLQKKDLEWSTNFNISANKNLLVSYPNLASSSFANLYVIGAPISIVKLYNYLGKDPVTGVYQFEDVNGDGQLTAAADRQTLVDFAPKFFGGIQNQIKYKKFQLDFLFQFVSQKAYGNMPGVPGLAINQLASVSDTSTQQPYTAGSNSAVSQAYARYALSTGNIEDASFVRLKNVSITYDLPLLFTQGIQCQLFAQGQNLWTWTKYSFGDPEFKFRNYMPPLRVFAAGMKINF